MRLIGYALLFLSCAFSGILLAGYYKEKIYLSQAYVNMLSSISEKIDILHLPLSKIYESLRDNELEKIGYLDNLKAFGLTKTYEKYQNKLLFDYEHIDFCEKLGTMPHGDTVKLCQYEINRLSRLLDKQKEHYEKKIKLSPALSILIGLAVIILII